MNDLTQGSIGRHLVAIAAPIGIGMLVQMLYFIVDLYFVGRLGPDALAGVGAAANVMLITMALTQVLSVSVVALIAQAVGRGDQGQAGMVFNQALLVAVLGALSTLAAGYAGAAPYMHAIAATPAIATAGTAYLHWFLPGLALQFLLAATGSALRGCGVVKPVMAVQLVTVLLNIVLAPVLIAGWGTDHPLGVAGAAIASSLAVGAGAIMMMVYFVKVESYVRVKVHQLRPDWATLKSMLVIGLPAGGEYFLMFFFTVSVYWVISGFGPTAQAGFGVGARVMQAIFLPALAITFAVPAVAGQNLGAGCPERVRETLKQALLIQSGVMLVLTLLCQISPQTLVGAFSADADVVAVGARFLQIASWNFVASGIVFACSGLFQALGNTLPSLLSTAVRLFTFVLPAVWLSRRSGFQLDDIWHLSVASVMAQALVSALLLQRQMRRRLGSALDCATVAGSAAV